MASDLDIVASDLSSRVEDNPYFKKIQDQLREKNKANSARQNRQDTPEFKKQESVDQTQKVAPIQSLFDIKDKAEVRSFKWSDTQDAIVDTPDSMNTSVDLKNDGIGILRRLGYKIDFQDKVLQLKETYMQNIIQSKSHNVFLARFAEFKVGVIGQLLAVMGVAIEELKILKKEALQKAIEENKSLMAENQYNIELVMLIYGNQRRVKKSLNRFYELERQLKLQMKLLGESDYWNDVQLLQVKMEQVQRIKEEFLEERKTLAYEFKQEV